MRKLTLVFMSIILLLDLTAQTPTVIIQTEKVQGTSMKFQMRLASAGMVYIDWGDGKKVKHMVKVESTDIQGLLMSNIVKIFSDELVFLNCGNNDVTDIDVSKAAELQQLYCDKNDLLVLDVSCNAKLVRLGCGSNKLTSLNLSKNPKLTGLYMQNNMFDACALNQIYNDIPKHRTMSANVNLRVANNPGAKASNTSFAFDKNWNIDTEGNNTGCKPIILKTSKKTGDEINLELRLLSNGEVKIDWGGNMQIFNVSTVSTKVNGTLKSGSIIKIYGDNVNFLKCERNNLVDIDVSGASSLQQIYCGYNLLKEIDVSNNTSLTRLGCNDNKITSLNIRNNSKLSGLYFQNNQLSACELNVIYDQLPSRPNTQDNVNFRVVGNPGAALSNTNIATFKNWNIDTKGDNTGCK